MKPASFDYHAPSNVDDALGVGEGSAIPPVVIANAASDALAP
jgi:hypothetical protein